MAGLGKHDYLQQFASIGVPGAWITNDDSVEATTIKIGGFPKYFYLWQKTKEESICSSCKQKMYLLTQINAPLMEEQCQRNIYVFMCRNSKCTKTNRGWNVMIQRGPSLSGSTYRKHHPCDKEDDAYLCDADRDIHKMIKHNNKTKSNRDTSSSLHTHSFWNINLNNNQNNVTSKPDEMGSQMQQKLDGLNDDFSRLMAMQNQLLNEFNQQSKSNANRKPKKKKPQNGSECTQKAVAKKGSFIPFEMTFYDEGYYKSEKHKTVPCSTIKWKDKEINLKTLIMSDGKGAREEEESSEEEEDSLSDYLERISADKTQCVRYCYGDRPLVPNKIDLDKIPHCKHCGQKKVFEFQIMSAALCYLEPKQIHHDWLTVLVFVCPLTCQQSDHQHVIVCAEQ